MKSNTHSPQAATAERPQQSFPNRPPRCAAAWWLTIAMMILWPAAVVAQSSTTKIDLGSQSRNVDFSGATNTKPMKTGTSLPGVCTTGEFFFLTTAAAGSNVYACTATNTWTQEGGSGGGGGGGGATSFSGLTDLKVTLGGNTYTIAAGTARYGNTTNTFSSASLAIGSGSDTGTVRFYVDFNAGNPMLRCMYPATFTGTYTPSGMSCVSGVAFPEGAMPLATAQISSGSAQSPADVRAAQISGQVVVAGSGLGSTANGRTITVTLDPAQTPQKFFAAGVPGSIAGATLGDLYTNSSNGNLYVCNHVSNCASGSGWVQVGGGGGALLSANNLSDLANTATARSNLGLAIGTNVQAFDQELAAVAGVTSAADTVPYFTGSGTASTTSLPTFGRSLIGNTSAANARSTLGVVIGTDVQAHDTDLDAFAGLTCADGQIAKKASGVWACAADNTGGGGGGGDMLSTNNLSDVANVATARSNLGLAIGTNVQAFDSDLSALAATASTGMYVVTGTGTSAVRSLASSSGGGLTWTNASGVSGNPTPTLAPSQKFTYFAASCQNGTAGTGFNYGATRPTPTCVSGTNTVYGVLQYPDLDGNYDIQFPLPLEDWNAGTITADLMWRSTQTTGDVVWQLGTVCIAGGESGDQAFNTLQTVTDTAAGTANLWNAASIASVTTTGCAAGETMFLVLRRNRTHASDTITGTPELIRLTIGLRRSL